MTLSADEKIKLGRELHDALFSLKIDTAIDLIRKGADLTLMHNGFAPLHCAAGRGDCMAPVVRELLAHGVDPDSIYGHGEHVFQTALQSACFRGHIAIAQALIEAKADIDINGGKDQCTPLMYALQGQHHDIAHILIDAGARLDTQDKNGWTACMYTIRYCGRSSNDALEKMIIKGARLDVTNNSGHTVLTMPGLSDAAATAIDRALQRRISLEKEQAAQKERMNGWIKQGCPTPAPISLIKPIRLKKQGFTPKR